MTARNLRSIPAINAAVVANTAGPALSKLAAFKFIRSQIAGNFGQNPAALFPAFNNNFTSRLGLN
jgi:hypothetical protein